MRNILVITLTMLLGIAGCTECNRLGSSSESVECQRLKHLFNNLEEENIKTILFFAEDNNEPIDEATFREFEGLILHLAGCCFCKPHPLAKEWTECNRLECIQQYLKNESVQRIAFYGFNSQLFDEDTERPEDWDNPWIEITEPKRIKEVTKILLEAVEKEHDRFVNEFSPQKPMQITTDKHKFIVYFIDYENAIRGIGWTSYELRKKLKEWGFLEPKKSFQAKGELISLEEHADHLAAAVRVIQEQTLEVIAQHRWLKRRLEKCIEKLEAERGLEPIPIEYPEREFLKSFPRRKADPNSMYTRPPEPWFVPYESPNPPAWPVDKQHDIRTLIALLRLQSISIKLYMSSTDGWIENFEKRLERLEGHLKE